MTYNAQRDFEPLWDRNAVAHCPNEQNDFDTLWDRPKLAHYLSMASGTLAIWDCTGRYNLHPVKVGSAVRYRLSHILQFVQWDMQNGEFEPMWDRKTAARKMKISPGTLAVWDCIERYNLHPIKLGRAVRYHPFYVRQFMNDRTSPS